MSDTATSLVVAIARSLRTDGSFVAHLDAADFGTGQLQAVVDVGWAARQAGQLLDLPVRVSTERADGRGSLIVTAVIADC